MALTFPTQSNNVLPINQNDRPKAEVWLNVGMTVEVPDAETGETSKVFVALPIGLPLDTMETMEPKGRNQNWANMVAAKNWVLSTLKTMAEGVPAGGEEIVEGLQIQIKRVGQPQAAAAPAENPFLAGVQARLKPAAD